MFVCHCYKKETCCDCHTKKRDGRSYVIPNDFRGKIDGIQSVRSTNWFQIKSSFIPEDEWKKIASTNDISYVDSSSRLHYAQKSGKSAI